MRLVIVGADIAHNFAVCTLGNEPENRLLPWSGARQIIADDCDGSCWSLTGDAIFQKGLCTGGADAGLTNLAPPVIKGCIERERHNRVVQPDRATTAALG